MSTSSRVLCGLALKQTRKYLMFCRTRICHRCYSSDNQDQKKKPLFSLDIDLSELDDFKSRKNNGIIDIKGSQADNDFNDFSKNDILADFLLEEENDSSLNKLDLLLTNLAEEQPLKLKTQGNDFLTADIENFDDHLEQAQSLGSGAIAAKESLMDDERDLFKEMFEKYNSHSRDQPFKNPSFLSDQVLEVLKDSFSKPTTATASALPLPQKYSRTVNRKPKKEAAEKASPYINALKRTLEYLNSLETQSQVMDFFQATIDRFKSADYDMETLFFRRRESETELMLQARKDDLLKYIENISSLNPALPVLTSETMPILFNQAIKTLANKFYDATLALTLFNYAKKDIGLYSVLCDQTSYNEMLKVYWVFYGKNSLYDVELIIVEMENNGFTGNRETLAILNKILSTYHVMRKGGSTFNPSGMPIWSPEEEKRAKNLETRLKKISQKHKQRRPIRVVSKTI